MSTVTERRRRKRIGLGHVEVTAKTVIPSECKILDIGTNGVCVATTQWLPINNNYSFKFHHNGTTVSNTGTVRWVKLVGTKKGSNEDSVPLYMTGMEFKSVLTDIGRGITRVLDRYADKEDNRQNGNRFKLKQPAKAVFNILKECRIRQISTGGMLIETDLDLLPDKPYSWAFNFPSDDHIICCTGRIVSHAAVFSKSSRRHHYGIAFTDVQKEARKNLARFVIDAMFTGPETSLLN
ncbi:MAG: PilZ domain-containing protein [Nitrospiraceae bacterium]|nr:MAG: PilZ domain-containing protein [Nitrospiraceae bacterium]